ncbi:hypothetical protein ANN_16864 [Periplaneta americana]|uniref:Uncharacterized protein n=1 Tax=Periplaneta americana TaxID=6978 RepID=A0ABQ8SST3_PERAM|nr:hypothetical protein ANN_16864 [Periplaneta americana]
MKRVDLLVYFPSTTLEDISNTGPGLMVSIVAQQLRFSTEPQHLRGKVRSDKIKIVSLNKRPSLFSVLVVHGGNSEEEVIEDGEVYEDENGDKDEDVEDDDYDEYYGKIMEVIDALDSTDSSAIAAVKSLPSEQLLEDILFIDSNFKIVSKSITLLESSKLQLPKALNIVDNVSQIVIQNITNFRKSEIRNISCGVIRSDWSFITNPSQKLQRVHNSCVRFVCDVRRADHITPSFQTLNWLRQHTLHIPNERKQINQSEVLDIICILRKRYSTNCK